MVLEIDKIPTVKPVAGLKQVVKEPTRGDYLLDLVLTDSPELLTVSVLPEISDHRVICIDVEVAVQYFESGAEETEHVHKIATELTIILSGRVDISVTEYEAGDIVEISPGEYAHFKAIEPTQTVVVKYPGAKNDKYLKEDDCD